jgi:hypothetical protein
VKCSGRPKAIAKARSLRHRSQPFKAQDDACRQLIIDLGNRAGFQVRQRGLWVIFGHKFAVESNKRLLPYRFHTYTGVCYDDGFLAPNLAAAVPVAGRRWLYAGGFDPFRNCIELRKKAQTGTEPQSHEGNHIKGADQAMRLPTDLAGSRFSAWAWLSWDCP